MINLGVRMASRSKPTRFWPSPAQIRSRQSQPIEPLFVEQPAGMTDIPPILECKRSIMRQTVLLTQTIGLRAEGTVHAVI